jgi:RNA polymerase sigma-70 factor (sigma-E family)
VDFIEFVTDRQRVLLRFAMALSGDAREAEEIVADVLARAYEQWDRISGLDRANGYVRRMVVNEFLSRRRRARKVTPLPDLSGYAGEDEPDPATGYAERDDLIARISALPPKQRAAIVLRYFEDLPDTEIAAVLGCSVGTVRSNIHRALATLRIEGADPGPQGRHNAAAHLIAEEI